MSALPASEPSFAAAYVLSHLDKADAAFARGADGVAEACAHAGRARSMIEATSPHDRVEWDLRKRLYAIQDALADAVREMDADDLPGRIRGALLRLRGAASISEIDVEIAARIALREEARVQMLHMLGRDVVLSWPDHHARYEIAAELVRMRRDGLVRVFLPMAFWRGLQWSCARTD